MKPPVAASVPFDVTTPVPRVGRGHQVSTEVTGRPWRTRRERGRERPPRAEQPEVRALREPTK